MSTMKAVNFLGIHGKVGSETVTREFTLLDKLSSVSHQAGGISCQGNCESCRASMTKVTR